MDKPIVIIGLVLLAFLVFLLLRELQAWYWKINERIKLQKETIELLRSIDIKLDNQAKSKNEENTFQITGKTVNDIYDKQKIVPWNCKHCHTLNTINESICEKCGKEKS
ncbi:MAG: hypothetical protein DRJ07_18315 [Bacteroidetes bacterium]|nr:MAG: hypothetical protein DRJ07_18315 [Bacteroidota bacterium]